ncbi:PGF-CTERM-anchored ABC transporter substrate-binding protein [Haladaptatus salinisoli]|uniref:PGF-CTERM-anchored ABC transporter substrate-binding protein n=1 Tax=Haladaptatus salinisoli TaxID=2884876 RepID=UPI001D0B1262|nr:PGF-CTERM-anchored ABC transporter substrate-binding protein [Haladaptatus salinisoli]
MRHLLLSAMLVVAAIFGSGGVVGATDDAADLAQNSCSFPFSKTDATGTEVTVKEEPRRIVTLSPSAAQTMWEIGGKEKVVGVTKYAMYLDGASAKVNVSGAGMTTVVPEKVVAQNPDLVLAPNIIPDQTVQKLRDAGLTVYKFRESKSIEDIYAKTKLTGQLTGECRGATETVSWMKDRVSTVRKAVEGEDRPKVLYVMGGGFTAGNGTFVNTIIRTAGGTNVAAEAGIEGYKQVSNEVVVQRQPEWFVLSGGMQVPDAYGETPAAKRNNTVSLNSNYVNQPAPRIVYPIATLAKKLHPEAYAEANATSTTTETTAAAETNAGKTTTTTATGSGGQPGFGTSAALAALALVALLARRE